MKKVQSLPLTGIVMAALAVSLVLTGTGQAQDDLPIFTGKFTLSDSIQWSQTVLKPGNYTITIGSSGMPTVALVRDGQGRPIARFVSMIDSGAPSAGDTLRIHEKNGRLCVYSLALASLGKVLVYDSALANESRREAHATQAVPVILARR